jgi:hypothetical protein
VKANRPYYVHSPKALATAVLIVAMNATTSVGQNVADLPCSAEVIWPNLTIARKTDLLGSVRDVTGAPFCGEYQVVIRDRSSKSELRKVNSSSRGEFKFADVPAGAYRPVLFKTMNGRKLRPAGFDQPTEQRCGNEQSCFLNITLAEHGSDLPYEFCPPK